MLAPILLVFFFNDTATTEIYTLSLHDALPIWPCRSAGPDITPAPIFSARASLPCSSRAPTWATRSSAPSASPSDGRSEEHTSELQSQSNLVCRLLLEKKKT